MTDLYIAAQNIPADSYVFVPMGSDRAYGLSPQLLPHGGIIIIGIASEDLREGFRIEARHGEVREDDA